MNKLSLTIAMMFLINFLVGCAGSPEVGLTEDKLYSRPMPKVEYEYELGPGDVIEIVYHYEPRPDTTAYYLAVGDVMEIEFLYHPDYNKKRTLRPDGYISMPRIGDVSLLGLTPSQAQKKLANLYSKSFKDPVISVNMLEYNRAIEHLKKAITTSERGQSKLTTIRPDGYVSFPVVNDILAEGKTLGEIKKATQKEYSKLIDNLTVSLILKVMTANKVYVFGEIASPNQYLMNRPENVSQMVARAGGTLGSGDRSKILVISRDENRRPFARIVNLEKVLFSGDISQDLRLSQYDVVFIPKTEIARRVDWVNNYINGLIPDAFSAGYDLGGVLIQNDPLIGSPVNP